MPLVILAIIRAVAFLGSRATNWVTANWRRVLEWINAGRSIEWIVNTIRNILGL